ncbi:MAG: hypothetical protein U9R02_01420 [Thermodesulfobacteriota bacterium]|nr:hypothetical protein [Thermodesulfobacteriota bacterium]
MTDFEVIFWTKGSVSKTRVRLKGSQFKGSEVDAHIKPEVGEPATLNREP